MEYLLQLIFAAIHLGGLLLYLFGLPAAVMALHRRPLDPAQHAPYVTG